jgi:hypothetical protein
LHRSAGPALLEAVLGRFRRWFQRDTGRRGRWLPSFGWRRWTPGAAYQRWLQVWADLRDGATDLAALARRHSFSPRQIQWVRRAGQAGLLNSTTPPAVRMAEQAAGANHRRPGNGPANAG